MLFVGAAQISNEENLEVNTEEYIESFKPVLMDVIYKWSTGGTFQEITDMTDIFEGSIIRATRVRAVLLLDRLPSAPPSPNHPSGIPVFLFPTSACACTAHQNRLFC